MAGQPQAGGAAAVASVLPVAQLARRARIVPLALVAHGGSYRRDSDFAVAVVEPGVFPPGVFVPGLAVTGVSGLLSLGRLF
jgi:hypothetical protein